MIILTKQSFENKQKGKTNCLIHLHFSNDSANYMYSNLSLTKENIIQKILCINVCFSS